MPFKKGQSGNPKGRPPKGRALADLLTQHANKRSAGGNGKLNKTELAERLWAGISTGVIKYEEHQITLEAKDIVALAKLLLQHLDGPATATSAEVNVFQNGARNDATINIKTVPGRDTPPAIFTNDDDGK